MDSLKPLLFEMAKQLPGSRFSTVGPASIRRLWRCQKGGTAGSPTRASSLKMRSRRPRQTGIVRSPVGAAAIRANGAIPVR